MKKDLSEQVMASVVEPDIADEIISSPVRFEDHADLALSLGILDAQRKEIEYSGRLRWQSPAGKQLILQVQHCLNALPNKDSHVVQQAIKVRKYIETVMLWEVADKEQLKDDLIRKLHEVNDQIHKLAGKKESTASDGSACLQFDAQFHKLICIQSGRANLTTIVEEVQKRLHQIGGPSNRKEILDVWSEHQDLIRALREKERRKRRQAISSSVFHHLDEACQRLAAKEGEMSREACYQSLMRGVERYFAGTQFLLREIEVEAQGMLDWYWESSGGSLAPENCAELAAILAMSALYPDKYVVYFDESSILDGQTWVNRKVLFVTGSEHLAYEYRDRIRETGGENADKLIEVEYQESRNHAFAAHV